MMVFIATLLSSTLSICSFNYASNNFESENSSNCFFENVKLYEEVLLTYYNSYLGNEDRSTNYSFEEFKNNYYSYFAHDLIVDYVDCICTYTQVEIERHVTEPSRTADGKFQLGCNKESMTSFYRFQNGSPFYNTNYYSLVKNGDIFMEDDSDHFYHVGIVTNLAYPYGMLSQMGTYVQVVEAINNNDGVQFGYLDDQRIVENKVEIYRYHQDLTTTQFNSIYYFLDEQIGDAYLIHLYLLPSINNDFWYCGELVYGAYLYANINAAPSFTDYQNIILGTDICDGTNVIEIDIEDNKYLTLQIIGFNPNNYTIRIFNNSSQNITAYYKSSTTTEDNAKNWTNLGSVTSIIISNNDYEDVTITKNGSYKYIATSLTFTKFGRTERLITYGYITTTFSIVNHNNIIFG